MRHGPFRQCLLWLDARPLSAFWGLQSLTPAPFYVTPQVVTSLIKRESKQSPGHQGRGKCVVWHCHYKYPQKWRGEKNKTHVAGVVTSVTTVVPSIFFLLVINHFCRPPNDGHHDSYGFMGLCLFLAVKSVINKNFKQCPSQSNKNIWTREANDRIRKKKYKGHQDFLLCIFHQAP